MLKFLKKGECNLSLEVQIACMSHLIVNARTGNPERAQGAAQRLNLVPQETEILDNLVIQRELHEPT